MNREAECANVGDKAARIDANAIGIIGRIIGAPDMAFPPLKDAAAAASG
jgi:hypothetical protein